MPLPIFDLGQARRAKALAAVIEARHLLTQARRQVVEEVRTAYAAFESSRVQADRVRGELIPLQQQRYRRTEAAFQAGEVNATDLLLAGDAVKQAQSRLIDLQQNATVALVRLRRAAGGPGVVGDLEAPATTPTTLPSVGPANEASPR